jgi:hypothetical protein
MEKAFHVQRVATKIKAAELAIDEALMLAAELVVEIRSAQDGLELGPIVTEGAFAKLAESIGQLTQARSSMVGTHKRLARIRQDRLPTVAGGIYQTKGALERDDREDAEELRVAG